MPKGSLWSALLRQDAFLKPPPLEVQKIADIKDTLSNSESVLVVNTMTGLFEDVFLPEGYILILPGYTLQRATCGIYKAAAYQVVSYNSSIWYESTRALLLVFKQLTLLKACV
ncbi:TPA: hypothetical protein ACH3X1_003249 [Trebouxia sp. C0004]